MLFKANKVQLDAVAHQLKVTHIREYYVYGELFCTHYFNLV